jgi:uncharacterized membrane protein YdbT with pleckstrin-like domain
MSGTPEWVTLTEGEEVVLNRRPSVIPYLTRLAWPLLVVLAGIGVWLVGAGALGLGVTVPAALPLGLVGLVVVALGLAWGAARLSGWWSTRYLVTTDEVYLKTGLFSRSVTNARLDQIQNTSFTQTALGRLFSYGDVHLDTAGRGGTEMVFEGAANPGGVVETITRELDRR